MAASAAEWVSGPMLSSVGDSGNTPAVGQRPTVVLWPKVPQKAAGRRTEPPVSEPIAKAAQSGGYGDRRSAAGAARPAGRLRVPGIVRGAVRRTARGAQRRLDGLDLAEDDAAGTRKA